MTILRYVEQKTLEYLEHSPKAERKTIGQFFTSAETAFYMAGLFCISNHVEELSILDPGAGTGILSAALIEKLQAFPNLKHIQLTCYENNPKILELLKKNLEWISLHSCKEVEFCIISDNYILAQAAEYNNFIDAAQNPHQYDLVICNPPYKKIPANAPEAHVMKDVCYGAPNLYFLFAEMALFNLKDNGEMVFIIPRSWTSGAYFKKFRGRFFERGSLEHIHLFASRNKVFDAEDVLQETMIVKVRKTTKSPVNISITTSVSTRDFSDHTCFDVPYDDIVRGSEKYVFLPTDLQELETLRKLEEWKETLPSLGLRMKTGLTVDFRNRDLLRDLPEKHTVPLFYSQHIQDGRVVFPVGKEKEFILANQKGLLQKNTNYLFMKRFTAKEEHRRLQCGVYLSNKFPEYQTISTQNKINFIAGDHDLSECVVYGLYVLFNSTLYDRYYRILNGSTQVNSTEVNSMPMPPMQVIEAMGRDLLRKKDLSEQSCDIILRNYL